MSSQLSYYELNKQNLERIKKESDPILDDYSFEFASRILSDGHVIVQFYLDNDTGLLTHKFIKDY